MKNNPATRQPVPQGQKAVPSSLRSVFIIASSVLVMLAGCLLATEILMGHFSKTRPMQPMQPLGIVIAPDEKPLTHLPVPNLELDDGHADYMVLRQRQSDKLNSYGWVDRSNGIVRVPIERAIDLIVLRGLPALATNIAPTRNALNLHSVKEPPQP
jgi:hypothetical protein